MASKANLVNLDAMITREDFAISDSEATDAVSIPSISIRDFVQSGLIGPVLRKPDFQRETNHWSPEQVSSLLECFVNGDLIPSVILWKSSSYLFVIDGGHRLSALKAWVLDDYGDGPISQKYFGFQVSKEQKKIAEITRNLINSQVGPWKHFEDRVGDTNLPQTERSQITAVVSRALPIQWVPGNAEKAENSFFKINTKGTALDDLEESLLRFRKKPASIASRAIIRAGKGHRYWSSFETAVAQQIEALAKELHTTLFDPELQRPIKTLDLPLGGPKGVRSALQILLELLLYVQRGQAEKIPNLEGDKDDVDGTATVKLLKNAAELTNRLSGNSGGSLGLHPAVYYYGPTGRHSIPMFLGTVGLIAKKLSNNDRGFFQKFSSVREKLEKCLVIHKELIATVLQKQVSSKRTSTYSLLLDKLITELLIKAEISDSDIVKHSGLEGKVVLGIAAKSNADFTDETRSRVFINLALHSALKCPICNGYLDPEKSVSYDHIVRKQDGGTGVAENCALTHPYCNQTVKN
jgi:Protein of unknown function DUF262/HNH endonuclease